VTRFTDWAERLKRLFSRGPRMTVRQSSRDAVSPGRTKGAGSTRGVDDTTTPPSYTLQPRTALVAGPLHSLGGGFDVPRLTVSSHVMDAVRVRLSG
jgi:hypothetical protein